VWREGLERRDSATTVAPTLSARAASTTPTAATPMTSRPREKGHDEQLEPDEHEEDDVQDLVD